VIRSWSYLGNNLHLKSLLHRQFKIGLKLETFIVPLACVSSVFYSYVRFEKKVEEFLSLLSPIFLCDEINDGGRSNTIINKQLLPTLKIRLHRSLDNGWLYILIGHFRVPQMKPHLRPNEAKCKTFFVKMSFICIKSHFHIKSLALTLVCKDR